MRHRNTMFKYISDSTNTMTNNAFELDYFSCFAIISKYYNCFAVIT